MEPNNLIVTVVSARGLTLKGHNKLEVFVNLTLTQSKHSSWKSRVQTDPRKTVSDCTWDQRCEFNLGGLDALLTILVNHKTVLGTAECIGGMEFVVRDLLRQRSAAWFQLRKKSNLSEVSPEKYRGELQLKFEFSNKLSASTLSINTVHETSSRLETLKRRMHIGKKKGVHSDASSTVSMPVSDQFHRRSSLCFSETTRNSGRIDFDNEGLIVPPSHSANLNSTVGFTAKVNSPYGSTTLNNGTAFPSYSRQPSSVSARNSVTSSPVTISEPEELSPVLNQRPRSVASSGFGSARSTLANGSAITTASHGPTREELMRAVDELRQELARKDAKIRDLHEYVGTLLARVIEKDPSILEATKRPFVH